MLFLNCRVFRVNFVGAGRFLRCRAFRIYILGTRQLYVSVFQCRAFRIWVLSTRLPGIKSHMNYYNKMEKNYSAWFQRLFISRNSLALIFLVFPSPWVFSEFVTYKQQYAVKGKNNAILLLEHAWKYFAFSNRYII